MKRLKPKSTNLWKMMICLLLVFALMWFLKRCSKAERSPFAVEYVKSQGDTLDIAIELNPTVYSIHADTISGFDYDLISQISKEHKVPIKFHPFVPLKHALDGLEKGDYDIVVAAMPMTSEMKEKFLMTVPVYLDRLLLIQSSDTTGGKKLITSQIELGGDTVWVPSDSPFASRIGNLADEIGDNIYVMTDSALTAEYLFMLVSHGKVKHAVINEKIAKEMVKDYPQVNIATPVSFTQFHSWALNRKDSTLLDSINNWIMSETMKN